MSTPHEEMRQCEAGHLFSLKGVEKFIKLWYNKWHCEYNEPTNMSLEPTEGLKYGQEQF